MADTILTFSGDGIVHEISYNTDEALVIPRNAISSDLTAKESASEAQRSPPRAAVQPPSQQDAARNDKTDHKNGDHTLYSYYLGSAGAVVLSFWVFTIGLAALGERLPRMCSPCHRQSDALTEHL